MKQNSVVVHIEAELASYLDDSARVTSSLLRCPHSRNARVVLATNSLARTCRKPALSSP